MTSFDCWLHGVVRPACMLSQGQARVAVRWGQTGWDPSHEPGQHCQLHGGSGPCSAHLQRLAHRRARAIRADEQAVTARAQGG